MKVLKQVRDSKETVVNQQEMNKNFTLLFLQFEMTYRTATAFKQKLVFFDRQ